MAKMIIDYDVRVELPSSAPMYGKSKLIKKTTIKNAAILIAREIAKTNSSVYVEQVEYASEANYKRGVSFQSSVIWNKWIDEMKNRNCKKESSK